MDSKQRKQYRTGLAATKATMAQSPDESPVAQPPVDDEAAIIAAHMATPESTPEQQAERDTVLAVLKAEGEAAELMKTTNLEQMVAQRKALDEQIKAARAAQPTVSKLEKVYAA